MTTTDEPFTDPLRERVQELLPQYEVDEPDVGYWARIAHLPIDVCRDEDERTGWMIADEEVRSEAGERTQDTPAPRP